jgi:pimeloyl-ACP methyl ester carboxylesterase
MPSMHFFEVQGTRLEVRQIAGSNERAPVVFLHEGLGSVSLWTQRGLDWPQLVCGATGRAGLVYSRRGYGQSDPVPPGRNLLHADYMHREAWEVLPALLAPLHCSTAGSARPVLLGHSDGATIALLYASRFPVSACIAMAPHVFVEDIAVEAITAAKAAYERTAPLQEHRCGKAAPSAREAAGAATHGGKAADAAAVNRNGTGLRERLARHHADVDGAFWQWNDVWLSAPFRNFDIRPECRNITAPLLLIQGLDDEYGSMRQLDEITLAAPHAQQLRLANCGHSPQLGQPARTAEAIAAFLEKVS